MYHAQLMAYNLEDERVLFSAHGETMRDADNAIVRKVLAYCEEHGHDARSLITDGQWAREELS